MKNQLGIRVFFTVNLGIVLLMLFLLLHMLKDKIGLHQLVMSPPAYFWQVANNCFNGIFPLLVNSFFTYAELYIYKVFYIKGNYF